MAVAGSRAFIISHSAQATPYASTTETADYLLEQLDIERILDSDIQLSAMRQTTSAKGGGFTVLGFEGTTGQQHMAHLHHIDAFWRQLPGKSFDVAQQNAVTPTITVRTPLATPATGSISRRPDRMTTGS